MAETKSDKNSLQQYSTPILAVIVVGLAFAVGMLWQKVQTLEKGRVAGTETVADTPTSAPQAPSNGRLAKDQAALLPQVNSQDHIRGSENADAFLVEYSDYYCPYCSQFHPTAKSVIDDYNGKVAWVYRHFPLDQLHPNARPLAEISECISDLAGEEAFWRFTDAVYAQPPADPQAAIALAVTQGVNESQLQACYDSGKFKSKVEDQYQKGLSAGVNGTPGNFIVSSSGDVWSIPGAVPANTLKKTIDEALAQ
jgi:protein-disulfide isomerase